MHTGRSLEHRASAAWCAAVAFLGVLAACGESPTAPHDRGPAFAVEVSDAVGARSISAASASGAITPSLASADRIAFVSVVPGTEPTGTSATIINRRTQASIEVPLVDGGFDPVGIPSEAGDTVEITILRPGDRPVYTRSTVPAARPPRVVRTSPARGRTDVAINATISVIFSEPVDPATVDGTSFRVTKDGVAIGGTVRPIAGPSIGIEFVPSSPLAPASAYELVLSDRIADLSGDHLTAPLVSGFTTEVSPSRTLAFIVQPSLAYAFTEFGSVIRVAAVNQAGAPDTTFSGPVSLSLDPNPGGAALVGASTVNAVRGVASFPDVAVIESGTYSLRAAAAGFNGRSSDAFGVLPSAWTLKASPSSVRSGPAMTAANGRLYLIGGSSDEFGQNAVPDVETYDPGTHTWASLPAMPTARVHLALGVIDGIIYAVGGSNASGALGTVEAYDPVTRAWATRASMPTARAGLAVAVVDGRLYALGGWAIGVSAPGATSYLSTVEVYDPVADRWSTRWPGPSQPPNVGVVGGIIYDVSGLGCVCGQDELLWYVLTYNPAADVWSDRGTHAEAQWGARGVLGVVGSLLYVNDQEGRSVAAYDASSNSWKPVPGLPGAGEAAGGVIDGVVYAIRNGKLYALADPCLGCWDY